MNRGVGPPLEYQRAGRQSRFTPVTTDTNYLPGKLPSQVKGTLTAYHQVTAATPGSAGTASVVPHATPDLNTAQSGQSSRIGSFTAAPWQGA